MQAGTNRRLISDVWQPGPLGFRYTKGSGHTTLEEYENTALFLQLDLPSTLIRHENAALFLRLGLPSTLIRHENAALFLRLGLPSTLICHENAALFLRLCLPSTLIRHENAAFPKRSSNRRNLIAPDFRFRVDIKHFENETS